MIDPSDAKQVKEDHLDILEGIIHSLSKAIKPEDKNEAITIKVGNQNVYKSFLGQEPTKNSISPEQVKKIQQALTEPQNLQGSVRITVGKDTVFHVSDGKIKEDRFGLVSKPLSENASKQLSENAAAPKIPTVESLQKQVSDLEERVQSQKKMLESFSTPNQVNELSDLKQAVYQQQQTIDQLKKGLEKVIVSRVPDSKNSTLQNWIGGVESKVKETSLNIWDKVKDVLTPKVDKLKTQVDAQISRLENSVNNLSEQVSEMRNSIHSNAQNIHQQAKLLAESQVQKIASQAQTVHGEVTKMVQGAHSKATESVKEGISKISNSVMEVKGRAIASSASALLNYYGKKETDGSVSYQSKKYHFSQKDNVLTVTSLDDKREVLNETGLTDAASERDVELLGQVQGVVDKYEALQAEQHTRSSGMRR